MNLLIWIAVGTVLGWILRVLTKDLYSGASWALLGSLGAIIGGRVVPQLAEHRRVVQDVFDPQALELAFCGAVVFLALGAFTRKIMDRRKARER